MSSISEHVVFSTAGIPGFYEDLYGLGVPLDEPTQAGGTIPRVRHMLRDDLERDVSVHINGLGGDHLFRGVQAWNHTLARSRPALAWSRARAEDIPSRVPARTTARQPADRRPYRRWLLDSIGDAELGVEPPQLPRSNDWSVPLTLPPWLTADGRNEILRRLHSAAEDAEPLSPGIAGHFDLFTVRQADHVSMTLTEFVTRIGDRWARGLDPTSTGETYGYGLKLRVLPALGHLPVTQITAGIIDRTIDAWEKRHGASTIKNSIAPLVRVLDEAVRDGLIPINPAKNRAKRSLNWNAFRLQPAEDASPRAHAIPDVGTLTKLAEPAGRFTSRTPTSSCSPPSSQRAHDRDRAGRDELGPDRQRSRPARPHPTRPPAYRRDMDGRCRHPAPRPPGHPRPRLRRDHTRIPAPRRPPRSRPTLSSPDPPRPADRAGTRPRGHCDGEPGATIGGSGPHLVHLSTGDVFHRARYALRRL